MITKTTRLVSQSLSGVIYKKKGIYQYLKYYFSVSMKYKSDLQYKCLTGMIYIYLSLLMSSGTLPPIASISLISFLFAVA